ncbi:flagellar basal body L-ring protein FlgH [Burkholderia ubonensis]|uniref:flagellar basal body L-ring protein FlgH n=1 Tax=Burkholderia ubonensis TaxID=101571 RepID=UPI0007536246|nr:flagellar basal body L-ring protein FlgH [Burkholderia ubonensis]KWB79423.1 flagellar basal body L-ring protein [Burkholderia ubonensis]
MSKRLTGVCVLAALAASLSGCVSWVQPQEMHRTDYDLPDIAMEPPHGVAGGLYAAQTAWSLTSDSRAYRPGDALTVLLQEETQASKKAGTTFDKKSGLDLKPGFLAGAELPFNSSLSGDRTFNGAGTSSQQNTLRGEITVIVRRVMPNGLLEVRGEKQLALNQGEEVVRLAGYVRPADIDTNNRVSSQRIADARIQYVGRGALADTNQPGWLTRFFNSPWMPF